MTRLSAFGLIGDGIQDDTHALQQAIDAYAASGERLLLPAGRYRCGTLQLRSHLKLELAAGALLIGSPKLADYLVDTGKNPNSQCRYLLWGNRVSDVEITGAGTIDGSGRAFWQDEYFSGKPADAEIEFGPMTYEVLKPMPHRPALLYFENCRNLRFAGIRIENAPAYTVWLLGCEEVVIENLTVRNPLYGPNTDVLDIDCCRRVTIRDCDLRAGDDCIALKSDADRLGELRPCEEILVEDCHLESSTCGVRIGYEGDAPIRRCRFSRLSITNTRHGLDLVSIAPGPLAFTRIDHGTVIEDISFMDIRMHNVGRAFFFWAGNVPGVTGYQGGIHRIHLQHIVADEQNASFIGSRDQVAVKEIVLNEVKLQLLR